MGFPIREYTFLFQQSPNTDTLKSALCTLTGLPLVFEEIESTAYTPKGIEVFCSKRPNDNIIINWTTDQNNTFVRVWSDTRQIGYLEISTLYLLKELGGKTSSHIVLPSWAGKQWLDVSPNSNIAKIKAWWKGMVSHE